MCVSVKTLMFSECVRDVCLEVEIGLKCTSTTGAVVSRYSQADITSESRRGILLIFNIGIYLIYWS